MARIRENNYLMDFEDNGFFDADLFDLFPNTPASPLSQVAPVESDYFAQQAEAASRQAEAQKKCRRLSTSNHLSSAAWRSASRDISVAEASPIAAFARTSPLIADRATSAMRTLDSFTAPVRFVDDEALISRGLAQTAEALVADGSVPAAYLT